MEFVRQNWVRESEFEALEATRVFDAIHLKIQTILATNRRAFVLLDLDSTLYEVSERSAQIFRHAARDLGELPAPVRARLETVSKEELGYSVRDSWVALGLCAQDPALSAACESLERYWRHHFFSDTFLGHDELYAETREWVNRLHATGAEIVYLTGRDEPAMRQGTLANLVRDGLPVGPGTHLCLKDRRDRDDVEHKVGAARRFAETGEIAASFENEPRNFAALVAAFPDASHVFVDTICSEKPAPKVRGVYRLRPTLRSELGL